MDCANWIRTVENGIARVPVADDKFSTNMWLTWSKECGFVFMPISSGHRVELWKTIECWFSKPVKRRCGWMSSSANLPWILSTERTPDALRVGSVLVVSRSSGELDMVPASSVAPDADIYWYDDPELLQTPQEYLSGKEIKK